MNYRPRTKKTVETLHRLDPIEIEHLKVQQQHAPIGHVVLGPYRDGHRWRCVTCSMEWDTDWHPRAGLQRSLFLRNGEDDLPWWHR